MASEKPVAPPVGAAKTAGAREVRNVILISWDGLDRTVVKELLEEGRLPNLAALIKEGSLQDIELKGHPTCTKPGHAVMLTGLDIKTTGVFSNSDYRPIPKGYTLFERLQKEFGKENIRVYMVVSKLAHVGARGPDEITGKMAKKVKRAGKQAPKADVPTGADDSPDVETKGEPFYLTKRFIDLYDGIQRTASETGPLCLKYLEQFKSPRFCAFLHFSDPDHAGHGHGSGSAEYREAAVADDEWLGKIVAWLKKENLYGETLVYVTADHGFNKNSTSHSNAPHSWLATNDRLVTHGGSLADITPTILARFGLDLDKLEPKLAGKPLTGPAPAPSRGKR